MQQHPDLMNAGQSGNRADGQSGIEVHRSRCWLEKHPEQRAKKRGAFHKDAAQALAPAEAYHRHAAETGERPADEPQHESGTEQ